MSAASGFTKMSFYGNKNKRLTIQARLNRKEKEFKKWPAPTPYIPKLGGPNSQWKIFRTQNEAFNFARSTSSDLSVFSCESESFCDHHGQRLFLVTSYIQLWHYYRQLSSRQRHHYEVIPEGSVCHLYFDLEFSKDHNPQRNGEEMVDIFIKYIISQLYEVLQITCSPWHVLQLDASTDHKFSQHLIFRVPHTVFKDNIHAGRFVHLICDQLLVTLEQHAQPVSPSPCKKLKTTDITVQTTNNTGKSTNQDRLNTNSGQGLADQDTVIGQGSTNQDDSSLTTKEDHTIPQTVLASCGLSLNDLVKLKVKDKEGRDILFCDRGVYTRNRNFRLFLSCKLGKDNPLVVAKGSHFKVNIPDGVKRSPDEQIFLDSLITNIQYDPGLRIVSMPENTHRSTPGFSSDRLQHPQHSQDCIAGGRGSPYPELDLYIESELTHGGTQGSIRHWTYFSSGELLVYDITNNRWCGNIQRQHKSNNVIYIADLRRGVYYQKCHDPQCKAVNYKSQEQTLPSHVLPATLFSDLDNDMIDFDDVSDADLLLAAARVEKTLSEINSNVSHQGAGFDDFDDNDDDDLIKAAESVENR